ncbi:AAA family ATPase [Nannocystis pusilla]|uniref:AAA family ATPase n=1 Tax=Nannocystis pusilla TaxID=889268 RepID=UPI003BF193EA
MTAAPPPEVVIFCGIQATGKSTFFQRELFHSHVRIGLDLVRTRHREATLFDACLRCGQSVVIDNTSPTPAERARYIAPARAAGFVVVGYYFQSRVASALARNAGRPDPRRVPDRGVLGTAPRLVAPRRAEGFDALHYVSIDDAGEFVVEAWRDDDVPAIGEVAP